MPAPANWKNPILGADVANKMLIGKTFWGALVSQTPQKKGLPFPKVEDSMILDMKPDAHRFFNEDLVPLTLNRRKLDRNIQEIRTYSQSIPNTNKSVLLEGLAKTYQNLSDNYHKGEKTEASAKKFIETSNKVSQQVIQHLKMQRGSRIWSGIRKFCITAVLIVGPLLKGLYSYATTGQFTIFSDRTKSKAKVDKAMSTISKIQSKVESPNNKQPNQPKTDTTLVRKRY